MRDLASPLLAPHVVSGLVGLSPKELRRWEAYGIPAPTAGRRPTPRLYSWRDVEQLQRARYLVRYRRVPLSQVGRLLAGSAPYGGGTRAGGRVWVVARPKPRRRLVQKGRRRRGNGIVAVRLPRSAKRRTR